MTIQRPTLVEFIVILTILAVLFALISPFTFAGLGMLGCAVVACTLLALLSPSWTPRLIFLFLGLAALWGFLVQLPDALPLQTRIHGANFNAAPVAKVFEHIARQRVTSPRWRFFINDHQAADRTITISIPEGMKMGEALEAVASATGYKYRWIWHKTCGNEPSPTCASFYFRHEDEPEQREAWMEPCTVMVTDSDTVWNSKQAPAN